MSSKNCPNCGEKATLKKRPLFFDYAITAYHKTQLNTIVNVICCDDCGEFLGKDSEREKAKAIRWFHQSAYKTH